MDSIRSARGMPGRASAARTARGILIKLIPAGLGILLARADIFGGTLAPFGPALVAAAGRGMSDYALAGVIIGYLIPGGSTGLLRHIATALAIAGIKWALGEFRKVSGHPAFPPCAALTGVVLTGVIVTSSAGAMLSYNLVIYIAEGMIAAAAAFFFGGGLRAVENLSDNQEGRRHSVTRGAAACLLVLLAAACVNLCAYTVAGFSPGTVLMLCAVVVAARAGGIPGGAAGGIAAGMVVALGLGSFAQCGIISCAGLMSGLFANVGSARVGRAVASAAFLAAAAVGSLGMGRVDVFFITEALLGVTAAILIPAKFIDKMMDALGLTKSAAVTAAPSAGAAARLRDAAGALAGVSETMEALSGRLDRLTAISPAAICRQATRDICAGCSISSHCWGEAQQESEAEFNALPDILKRDGHLNPGNSPDLVGKRCARSGEMIAKINGLYSDFAARESARRRLAQVRAVVSDQLGGVGQLLYELSDETHAMETPDRELCTLAGEVLCDAGYAAETVLCAFGAEGGLTISATITGKDKKAAPRSALPRELGDALGVELREDRWDKRGDEIIAEFSETPPLTALCGAAQHCRDGERLCGDSYDLFTSHGGAYLLLSDGMGTGGRAAVDSAMTCTLLSRLLGAGFSLDGACKIVNASLLVKSDDESLSTVDCVRVNLFTGEADICKAGAAASFLRQGDNVRVIDMPSLPLGILRKTDLGRLAVGLDDGDVVIMASDGAAGEDTDWITDELRNYDRGDPREFARSLADIAASRATPGHDDDITVLVMQMEARK